MRGGKRDRPQESPSKLARGIGAQLRAAYPPDSHADAAMQRLLNRIEALTTPKGSEDV